jgi:hypothetical protein
VRKAFRIVADRSSKMSYLPMRRGPHQNALSEWMNDPRLTPVLHEMLSISAEIFRAREAGATPDNKSGCCPNREASKKYGTSEDQSGTYAACRMVEHDAYIVGGQHDPRNPFRIANSETAANGKNCWKHHQPIKQR